MMKQTLKIVLVTALGLNVSYCASMVDQTAAKKDEVGKRTHLSDARFQRFSTECPNGVVLAALWHDTTIGNQVHFRAGSVLSKEALPDDLNLYVLARTAHRGFDKEKMEKYTKAEIKPPFPSMSVKFLKDKATDPSIRAATDPEKLKDVKIGDEVALVQTNKVYHGTGTISEATLSPAYLKDKTLIQSISLSVDGGKSYANYPIPSSVVGSGEGATDFTKGLSGTTDADLTFAIEPSDEAASLLVQITNDQPKKKGATYQFVETDIQGKSEITVPLKGVEKGSYKISIMRVQGNDANFGDVKACVDVASGVRTEITVAEPKKEEEKK